MLDQGGYGSGARWHLRIAVERGDVELAEWCLTHGASPDPAPERARHFSRASLYEQALQRGRPEIAEMLARFGAPRADVVLSDEDHYVAASLRLDGTEARRLLAAHPGYQRSTAAMFAAVRQDRADAVAFLLDLGTPIEVEDANRQRPLHVAAANDAVRVAAAD
jgi:ankyrin repeat protein